MSTHEEQGDSEGMLGHRFLLLLIWQTSFEDYEFSLCLGSWRMILKGSLFSLSEF